MTPEFDNARAAADIQEKLQEGVAFHKGGNLSAARAMYQKVLALQPLHFDALHLSGVIALQAGDYNGAADLISRAIGINSQNAAAYNNYGNALAQLKQYVGAIDNYDKAIALKPGYAEAYNNRGTALLEAEKFQLAVESFEQAVKLKPGYIDALNNYGVALRELKRYPEALASFDQVLRLNGGHAEAHCNRGLTLSALQRHDAALAAYGNALRLRSDYADAYCNRGLTFSALHQYAAALADFDKAIQFKPDFAEAYNNRGIALASLSRLSDALGSYDKAISLKPGYADAYNNRGHALTRLRQFEPAIDTYAKALRFNARQPFLYGAYLYARMQICDWRDSDRQTSDLTAKIERGEKAMPAFPMLALTDSLSLQRKAAEIWVNDKYPSNDALGAIPARPQHDRIRIGYFSMDFHEHPVAYLTAELFEIHDREKFEVYAFSYGPDTQDAMRKRLEKAFDKFIDVRDRSDKDVAELARALEIDIAIDLAGHTADARTGIFALRAAPIQTGYLGYLGTMGATYIDYALADKSLIPVENRRHFAEKIVYLPSFQVNDSKRTISKKIFTREELGLPETGFVFCCFNNTYKITPATFNGWARILKRVEGSVLLLYAENEPAAANLRKEAALRGLAPERLVFGARLQRPDYLARYRAADIFLDTLPYNAGTTASDALWAGLPVLTRAGEAFAARTAASVLNAVELPELITATQMDYEDLAVELATNPPQLQYVKEKLARNRLTTPLFDPKLFARHIEDAYAQMYERHLAGLPPDHITVAP